MNAINKALTTLLMVCVLANGVYAVYLSHVSVSLTWSIGPQVNQAEVELAQVMPVGAYQAIKGTHHAR